MQSDQIKKIIFVIGSTASGKSHWALELAQKYRGSIVNIDSIQFYKGLVVGSAAPLDIDKAKAPHYLYNYVSAPLEMTAGEFLRDFYKLLENKNLKFPLFVVGGTGFYIQALEKGMFDIPEIPPALKTEIEKEILEFGNEKAYAELIAFDTQTQIHVNDAYRIGRALEVKRAFGKTMSQLQAEFLQSKKFELKIPYLKIGRWLDKEILFKNVSARTKDMLKNGLVEEVEYFMKQGYAEWAPLKSVGYFEVLQYHQKCVAKDQLNELISQSTMRLIKKQKTWFKRDNSVLWSDGDLLKEKHIEDRIDQF